MPKPVFIISVKIPQDEAWVLECAKELAEMKRASLSEVVRAALKEYVKAHKGGNPQKPFFPHMKP